MGSFDDFVITPHSSFSELGSTLSYTWLPDANAALRTLPNRPVVPLFVRMNDFERMKVQSLLDRRAVPARREGGASSGAGNGQCMRLLAAGMSVTIAQGKHLTSMFEAIEDAECLKGRRGIANV